MYKPAIDKVLNFLLFLVFINVLISQGTQGESIKQVNVLTIKEAELLVEEFVNDVENLDMRLKQMACPDSNISSEFFKLESFNVLKSNGVQVIPAMIDYLEQNLPEGSEVSTSFRMVFVGSEIITKRIIRRENISRKGQIQKYIDWWKNGYENDVMEYKNKINHYKNATDQNEKRLVLNQIKSMGIRIVPDIIEEINNGNTDFIEVVNSLTDEKLKQDFISLDSTKVEKENIISMVNQWWDNNKTQFSLDYEKLFLRDKK